MGDHQDTILITGGAGFIGSNFIKHYLTNNPKSNIVNLDKLTYAANLENLSGVEESDHYEFIHGDICDVDLVNTLFKEKKITGVINFAAESHVDNSIENPDSFIRTNIQGTYTLLEAANKHWMQSPHKVKPEHKKARFHHISTDEVYGSLGDTGHFTEESSYAPNSPYSASKASSDFLVRSYHHTYGVNTIITNCSNNYGPNQHDEKLIPTIIRKALTGENIPIYGDGKNVRDWLYVEDHCFAIKRTFESGTIGETYLIGGASERDNLSIANIICKQLDQIKPKESGSYLNQITFVKDRPGHDFRYAVDFSKIREELNWEPSEKLDSGIRKTINFYLKKYLAKK